MAHYVTITTPIPSWKQTVKRLGLSKGDQKFVECLFDPKCPKQPAASAVKAGLAYSVRAKSGNKAALTVERKPRNRARKVA